MTVTAVTEIWRGRRETATDTSAALYTRTLRVLTDSPLDGAGTVLAAAGVPRIFDAYFELNGFVDLQALCFSVEPECQDDDPTVWQVRCQYSTDLTKDPTAMNPEVEWSIIHYTVPAVQDNLGFPILNTADDPYDPPAEMDESRLVLRYSRNEWTYDPSLALLYQDAVSNDVFFGQPAGTAKMASISAVLQNPQTGVVLNYWRVTYEVHFRKESWSLKLLDAGYRFLDLADANKKKIIRDPVDGTPLANPSLLDGFGHVLAAGAAPFYNTFLIYNTQAFAALNLRQVP